MVTAIKTTGLQYELWRNVRGQWKRVCRVPNRNMNVANNELVLPVGVRP